MGPVTGYKLGEAAISAPDIQCSNGSTVLHHESRLQIQNPTLFISPSIPVNTHLQILPYVYRVFDTALYLSTQLSCTWYAPYCYDAYNILPGLLLNKPVTHSLLTITLTITNPL